MDTTIDLQGNHESESNLQNLQLKVLDNVEITIYFAHPISLEADIVW